MYIVTLTEAHFYMLLGIIFVGLLVAPTLCVWLRSWEHFGGWRGSSFAAALFISAVIVVLLPMLVIGVRV